jgi:hypothetical protein
MTRNCNKRIVGTWLLSIGLIVALGPAVGFGQETPTPGDQDVSETPTTPEAPAPQNPWDAYEVILKRNMFSRQRGERPIRDREERSEIAMPNLESYFRLKGIVQEDGEFIAFIEDIRSSSVLKLQQGDAVARGTIKTLTLDSIEYQCDDQVTTVTLGYDLEGGQGAVTMSELMEWSPTTPSDSSISSPDTATETPPTGEAADILKQLMERRKQQLGQ